MGFIKDIIEQHANKKDDLISQWYWRKKYNTLKNEFDTFKEVVASDIYKRVTEEISQPMELKRYKKTIERLNNKVAFIQEERNKLYDENKLFKKKVGTIQNVEDEG